MPCLKNGPIPAAWQLWALIQTYHTIYHVDKPKEISRGRQRTASLEIRRLQDAIPGPITTRQNSGP